MNHWLFIAAAYAITVLGTCGTLLWTYRAMRRAEADADALRREP